MDGFFCFWIIQSYCVDILVIVKFSYKGEDKFQLFY